MQVIIENLLAKSDLLIVFIGMAVIVWRQTGILRDITGENVQLSQLLAKLLAGQPSPPISIPAAPAGPPQPAAQKTAPMPDSGPPVDEGLVAAVKKFEGFSAKAYGDFKQNSIGYGTRANSQNEVIDEAEADRRLRAEISEAAKSVEAFCPNAPKGVKQAMIDMTYNVGPVWQHNDLGKLIQAGSYEDAKAHVLQYNHAGGQVNDGLTKRRQAEVQWFDHPL